MNYETVVNKLSKVRPSATLATISNYKNSEGEVADYSVVLNFSYENALKRSIETLESYTPENDEEILAKESLLQSFNKSLTKDHSDTTDGYESVTVKGKALKGVKKHTKTNTLHLSGMLNLKRVITSVSKKEKKQTAKDKLLSLCPISKYRQFKIDPHNCASISIDGTTIKIK